MEDLIAEGFCCARRSDAAVYEGCHMPAFGAHEVVVETTDHEVRHLPSCPPLLFRHGIRL